MKITMGYIGSLVAIVFFFLLLACRSSSDHVHCPKAWEDFAPSGRYRVVKSTTADLREAVVHVDNRVLTIAYVDDLGREITLTYKVTDGD